MKTSAVLVFALALAGCATAPEPEVRSATRVARIDIRSVPPGCVVELNNEYLGVTPLELVVNATDSGNWPSEGWGSAYIMRCSTPTGQSWEQKVWFPGNRIPSRILFRIPGATRGLAVN